MDHTKILQTPTPPKSIDEYEDKLRDTYQQLTLPLTSPSSIAGKLDLTYVPLVSSNIFIRVGRTRALARGSKQAGSRIHDHLRLLIFELGTSYHLQSSSNPSRQWPHPPPPPRSRQRCAHGSDQPAGRPPPRCSCRRRIRRRR
jgi:hypothetical protein